MKTSQLVSLWFGLIMVLVVGSGALLMTFTDFLIDKMDGPKRSFFIILLYAYFVYRLIRTYQLIKQARHHD